MAITVRILKRGAGGPTLYATRELDLLPVSIGRDSACTIALEDPNKHMSRFHVEIEEESGVYWMSVVSKVNPVTVKGRRHGPGARLVLNSGDSFELADYEVQVLLPEAVPEAAEPPPEVPMPAGTAPGDDDAERLFNESTFFGADEPPPAAQARPPSTDPQLQVLMQAETAPGEDPAEQLFNESTFLGTDPARPARAPAKPTLDDRTPPEETFLPSKAATAPFNALHAFLGGAGLAHKDLPAAQAERMLRDGGAILRAAVEGIMKQLLARAEMRKAFEAEERTTVAARDRNALKRSSDPREAMDFLLDPARRTGGVLDPVQAVSEACDELRAHELALMAGMRAAIIGALGRFDPQVLERALEKGAKKGFTLASRKAKLWDLFVEEQGKLARQGQEDFNQAFGRDFLSAYQAQLRRLKGGR